MSAEHEHRVEGGYKATLSNPNSSEEAKKHAQEMLDKAGVDANERRSTDTSKFTEEEKHKHRVEGGYKATLSNAKSSEEAKKHAQAMLDKIAAGEELPESERAHQLQYSDKEKHLHRVEGGYKGTLSNANSSEEAKKHAQAMLDKIAAGEELPESEYTDEEKHRHRVLGGYKGTLSNANSSEEAKKHAKEMIEKLSKDEELPESEYTEEEKTKRRSKSEPKSEPAAELTEEEKHRHHVIGGYKATLSNANASEEAKKHAQEMLDQMEKEDGSEEKRGLKRSSDDAGKESESTKGKQGFASMPKEKVQEIASLGGRTVHAGEEPLPKKGKTDSNKSDEPSAAK